MLAYIVLQQCFFPQKVAECRGYECEIKKAKINRGRKKNKAGERERGRETDRQKYYISVRGR